MCDNKEFLNFHINCNNDVSYEIDLAFNERNYIYRKMENDIGEKVNKKDKEEILKVFYLMKVLDKENLLIFPCNIKKLLMLVKDNGEILKHLLETIRCGLCRRLCRAT